MKGMRMSLRRWSERGMRALRAFAIGALGLGAGNGLAQTSPAACDPPPAKAASVQGTVEARRVGDTQWRPIKLNDTFCPGDVIRVQERSRADITLLDQSVLRLNANSSITVEAPKERRTGVIDLARGTAHFFSRGPNSLEVKTPFTVAGVRGTEFLINVEDERALLTVFEGTVVAQSPAGSLTLTDGQSAAAERGKAPALRVVARPRDAVHWALYYPPVVYFKADEYPGDTMDKAPAAAKDPRVQVYRAHRLLAVGSVDEAQAAIEAALKLAPNDADALSLQSIMAVVQGDKDRALQIAQAAVSASPNSATALIARSYAEQARFDLEAARASVQRAVELEASNALAWARLAELQSSFGEIDKANEAAQRAVELQPDLSRTQTVIGFAQLTAIKIAPAMQSFEKAIALDQADPLPRLGLGLAKIRGGDLEAGGRELEIAASLDPSSALVRSYLGKAYYEEKRGPLDEREFQVAKQLDPKDPTPWFYDAIAKLTTNRPVEALQAMETARELNDNRAVYRSQLLLDSDAAARAASQARIFGELGFQQRALVEGWDAVNRDPSNFSAHRFLADSYAAVPRHEIARVSELLQSQLLSPVTNTPLQPRLSESNLFLISSLGPGIGSFNEFNPLFNRDGISVLLNGMTGSKDTVAGDVVVSGIAGGLGFSVGASGFNTDGFRTNNDQKETLANVFLQYDFSPSTSAQYEYRYRNSEFGDLAQRFFPTAFFPGQRTDIDTNTHRVGLKHAFSPASTLLGSVIVQDRNIVQKDTQPIAPVTSTDSRGPEKSVSAEMQHIYRASRFSVTSGLGYFDIDGTINRASTLAGSTINLPPIVPCRPRVPFPPNLPLCTQVIPPQTIRSTETTDIQHVNAYAYANFAPIETLTLTAGLSGDFFDDGSTVSLGNKDQFNPKLGMTWRAAEGTTVRAAAFRTFKRRLITDQTLEPTQVAGFNQFYDEINATSAWRYGIGVDQKFTRSIFGGAEISKRDIDMPVTFGTTILEEQVDEHNARLYAYWTPHPWVALRAEYLYEKLERSGGRPGLPSGPVELTTHRLPLSVNLFHPSGWGGGISATYVDQDGRFLQGAGSDKFWIVDLALKYRLPKRNGFLSAGVRNATDKQFNFFDTDTKNPQYIPTSMAFVQLNLSFP